MLCIVTDYVLSAAYFVICDCAFDNSFEEEVPKAVESLLVRRPLLPHQVYLPVVPCNPLPVDLDVRFHIDHLVSQLPHWDVC